MLIALIWWSYLLYSKNEELYKANSQLISLVQTDNTQSLESITKKYEGQKRMIIGEGLAFGFMLVIGIFLIIRSYTKELEIAQKENNFLLSITHELKSPISSIQLILDTFKKRKLKEEMFYELNDNALDETKRLNTLVGNLLFANKLNYGQEYYFEVADLSQLLESTVDHYSKSNPKIRFEKSIDTDVKQNLDQDAISIAINNLISNAIKYTGENKEIKVCLEQKEKVVLSVIDQGIGIPKSEKSKIFSKFYRVGNEDIRSTKGTGLGLYICKEIVNSHKGTIEVLDNEPKGSIFKITLPKYVG